jgi:hypothetical protein
MYALTMTSRQRLLHGRVHLNSLHHEPHTHICSERQEDRYRETNPSIKTIQTSTQLDRDRGVAGEEAPNLEADKARRLTAEAVQGAALSLQSVDDVKGSDGLALGVLGVCDSVADDALEEGLEDTAGLFVDHCSKVSEGVS